MRSSGHGIELTGGDLRRAAVWTVALAGVVALVSFEQGLVTGGEPVLHEVFHDARHLLGFPCH